MSGKPKIYQGVRVKITVKELLQQRRAKQAVMADETVSAEGSSSVQFTEAFCPPCAGPYADVELDSSSSNCLPPWQLQNCTSCEEIPSYLEHLSACLQPELPLDALLGGALGDLPCSPDSFQSGLACLNPSLGSGSPDSSDPSGLLDYSYSPPQLPPFEPLGYGPPSPPEARSCMFAPSDGGPFPPDRHGLCHPASPPCCCPSCGAQRWDALRVPEYFSSATADCKDYAPSASAADDFFRRDRSWHSCCS